MGMIAAARAFLNRNKPPQLGTVYVKAGEQSSAEGLANKGYNVVNAETGTQYVAGGYARAGTGEKNEFGVGIPTPAPDWSKPEPTPPNRGGGGGSRTTTPTITNTSSTSTTSSTSPLVQTTTPSSRDTLRVGRGGVTRGSSRYTGNAVVPDTGGKTANQLQQEAFLMAREKYGNVKRNSYVATYNLTDTAEKVITSEIPAKTITSKIENTKTNTGIGSLIFNDVKLGKEGEFYNSRSNTFDTPTMGGKGTSMQRPPTESEQIQIDTANKAGSFENVVANPMKKVLDIPIATFSKESGRQTETIGSTLADAKTGVTNIINMGGQGWKDISKASEFELKEDLTFVSGYNTGTVNYNPISGKSDVYKTTTISKGTKSAFIPDISGFVKNVAPVGLAILAPPVVDMVLAGGSFGASIQQYNDVESEIPKEVNKQFNEYVKTKPEEGFRLLTKAEFTEEVTPQIREQLKNKYKIEAGASAVGFALAGGANMFGKAQKAKAEYYENILNPVYSRETLETAKLSKNVLKDNYEVLKYSTNIQDDLTNIGVSTKYKGASRIIEYYPSNKLTGGVVEVINQPSKFQKFFGENNFIKGTGTVTREGAESTSTTIFGDIKKITTTNEFGEGTTKLYEGDKLLKEFKITPKEVQGVSRLSQENKVFDDMFNPKQTIKEATIKRNGKTFSEKIVQSQDEGNTLLDIEDLTDLKSKRVSGEITIATTKTSFPDGYSSTQKDISIFKDVIETNPRKALVEVSQEGNSALIKVRQSQEIVWGDAVEKDISTRTFSDGVSTVKRAVAPKVDRVTVSEGGSIIVSEFKNPKYFKGINKVVDLPVIEDTTSMIKLQQKVGLKNIPKVKEVKLLEAKNLPSLVESNYPTYVGGTQLKMNDAFLELKNIQSVIEVPQIRQSVKNIPFYKFTPTLSQPTLIQTTTPLGLGFGTGLQLKENIILQDIQPVQRLAMKESLLQKQQLDNQLVNINMLEPQLKYRQDMLMREELKQQQLQQQSQVLQLKQLLQTKQEQLLRQPNLKLKTKQVQIQQPKLKIPTIQVPITLGSSSSNKEKNLKVSGKGLLEIFTKGKKGFEKVGEAENTFSAGKKLETELFKNLRASGYVSRKGEKVSLGELKLSSKFRPSKMFENVAVQKQTGIGGRLSTLGEKYSIKKAKKEKWL